MRFHSVFQPKNALNWDVISELWHTNLRSCPCVACSTLATSSNLWPPGTEIPVMTSRIWSRVYVVNEWVWGARHVLTKSLFCNKIKFVKSWVKGKGKLTCRQSQGLPRLKYAVQSHAVTRLTFRLTSSLCCVAIRELSIMWKEAVVAGVELSHHLPGGTEEKYGRP